MRRWFLVLIVVLAGCASDGRSLREASADQTTTTRPPPPTSALDQERSPTGLELKSPDFLPGAPAPIDVTCDGENRFPNLAWEQVPVGAAELAVTLSDQTDPENGLLLWLMAGISPSETGLQSGIAPAGAYETLNDYGNLGYGNPCLEGLGEGTRDLQFRLYVLDQPSGLAPGDPGNDAWLSLQAQATDSATVLMRITPPEP